MKILDRYIIRQFLVNYCVLLAVLMLLIIMLDLIFNLDEFVQVTERMPEAAAAEKFTAVVAAIFRFYWPKVFLFFIYAAGVLPIGAAGFTLAGFIRNRELTAILAGGVSMYRVALPLLLVGCVLSCLTLVDYELIIPRLRERLIVEHHQVKHGGVKPFRLEFVPDLGPDADGDGLPEHSKLFSAAAFDTRAGTMSRVSILVRDATGRAVRRIVAAQAAWDGSRQGWELIDGYALDRAASRSAIAAQVDPRPVDFIQSNLDPTMVMLHRNARLRQLLSVAELNRLMASEAALVDAGELRRILHGRFAMIVTNVLILAIGLPFFLVRGPANLLRQSVLAAPLCLGAWAGGFIIMQVGSGFDHPAANAMSAWLATLIYLPVALFMMDRVET